MSCVDIWVAFKRSAAISRTARRFWALAGTWLETERAEYRLAMTWLQAGDPALARHHAQQCLAIVQANGSVPLERFFASEALALAEAADGNAAGHAAALAQAREAFAALGYTGVPVEDLWAAARAALDEADQSWCRASLDKLAG